MPQSQSLSFVMHCSASLCNRPSIFDFSLTATISFNIASLNSEESTSSLHELINQGLLSLSCPSTALHGQRPSQPSQGSPSFPLGISPLPHPSPIFLLPAHASSHLMSQFRNRDAPAATWEGSGPPNI